MAEARAEATPAARLSVTLQEQGQPDRGWFYSWSFA